MSSPEPVKPAATHGGDGDGGGLAEFGYSQTLDRSIGKFSSFAAGISYISILTGTFQLFYFGFGTGGAAYWWSWPMVFAGQFMVALSFAELAGRYPVAGSVYNWSKRLAGPTTSWMAGWMMFTASVVSLSAVALAAQLTFPQIWSGFQVVGDAADPGAAAVNGVLLGAILIVFTTVINAIGVKLMARINSTGVFIELIAAVVIVVALLLSVHNPVSVLFETPPTTGGGGYFGTFLVAALASAYVMYGFDTASSLGEETVDPRRTAPAAILRAVVASFVLGGLILLGIILAAPDLSDPRLGTKDGGGQLVLLQVAGGTIGRIFLITISIAVFVCLLAVQTAAIRLMFAMARDNGLPAGALLARIDPKHKTPVVPAIVIGAVAILILLANVGVPEVFTAVTSVAIIMIYIAYLLVTVPMLVRRLRGQWPDEGQKGYFTLGRLGLPVNILAVCWGAAMALNLAWPREEVYGTGWLRFIAFIFIGVVASAGLLWFRLKGRHQLGCLPEHRAKEISEGMGEKA
ncbi:Urea carboxylase-related amino acid permease [Pseudonocardia sp. Ae168_Ps1]|uniref:APC family permease n=1 Tax=unclassified Pseudonocardia TaxID=2619320 RepID=UPI000705F389|nr:MULTISPECIES: amino acid permease [unclassified Pseudonocardia]ALL76150.1 amino acid permease [Pseudonocardia sp. EC080610-09]ALL83174.1 amino acid permease [Pseudonocardia sp. EC080619-01]OLL73100.1 Urea carboxylase-related amino acid permease [Pseudonocardia sp. Ae150A_Ps1]OLL79076.1 Urea carboxylase-related amino acid permease [Pseudonocardia sp. Ae168_Ps1]OLL86786.1 Urea carboxylase-related amino acid permease [Pseudonocardia sp. Ae263_Ps1]